MPYIYLVCWRLQPGSIIVYERWNEIERTKVEVVGSIPSWNPMPSNYRQSMIVLSAFMS